MRTSIRLLISLFCFVAPSTAGAGYVGAYIWGGVLTNKHTNGPDSFYDTVEFALGNGFDTIRFMIGPNTISDYKLPPETCSLTLTHRCLAKVMLNSPVWDNAQLKRIVITSMDFICSSPAYDASGGGCLNPSILTAHSSEIQSEYLGLLEALKDRFGTRDVQFVLSNWEGDNMVYCGDVGSFALNPAFPAVCKATWPAGQTNAQRVQALLRWFSMKDAAIATFLVANPTFNVIHAPEFASYKLFRNGCNGNCVLNDNVWNQIRLSGGRQYCSYSSYDSEGPPGGTFLAEALEIIATGCNNLQIGEAGYDLNIYPPSAAIDLFKALFEINKTPGILGVIPWNFVGGQRGVDYGLFTTDGTPHIVNYMGPLRPLPAPTQFRSLQYDIGKRGSASYRTCLSRGC
jgi:hypothetical protein